MSARHLPSRALHVLILAARGQGYLPGGYVHIQKDTQGAGGITGVRECTLERPQRSHGEDLRVVELGHQSRFLSPSQFITENGVLTLGFPSS